ncbi:MAG: hypothetical protein QM764_06735, partial [Chitinophagaceae bacterium]
KILTQSFVLSFYRENASLFVFVFTIFFFVVGTVDGAGLYRYHYSLVTAMLNSIVLLLIVFFVWLLYARKFSTYVSGIIKNPAFQFLHVYNCLPGSKRRLLLLLMEIFLMLPLIGYSIFIGFVAIRMNAFIELSIIYCYLILLCIVPTILHFKQLNAISNKPFFVFPALLKQFRFPINYPLICLRFIFRDQLTVWSGIKVYTCGILYLMVRNNTQTDYEIATVFFFFIFGILANCILISRLRSFEETYFPAYRSLSIKFSRRYSEYAIIYLITLLPEIFTAIRLTPAHLHVSDAIQFLLCGYSTVLLMHSIQLRQNAAMKEFLKILLLLLFMQYFFFMAGAINVLSILSLVGSVFFFLTGYYRFEKKPEEGIIV